MKLEKLTAGAAVLAGPVYLGVGLTTALLTPGFDLSRHPLSLSTLGPLGAVQMANFWVTGLLVVVASLGWKRTAGWFLRLYGVALVLAGVFLPDPVAGFPPGAEGGFSWHGMLHFAVGGVGFLFLFLSTVAMGLRQFRSGKPGWAGFGWVTGVVFLAAFAWMAGSGGSPGGILTFWLGLALTFVWIATTGVSQVRASPVQ